MKSSTLRQIGILGTGSYVPEHILTNADLEKMVDTSDEWIRTRTGIRERRIAEPGTSTVSLAKKAAEKAMANAGVTVGEIDLVVVATCTQDTIAPSTACALQDMLGIPVAGAFDLSAGCSGFVYATAVASQMLATGLYQKALVVGAEVLSRFVDWTDRNTCVLFGDGAGAAVVGPLEDGFGLLASDLGSDGSFGDILCIPAGGVAERVTHEAIEDGRIYVHMDGTDVFKAAVRHMEDTTKKALEKAGLVKEDIQLFIAHQANNRIIQALAKKMELPEEKVYVNVNRYGNTSAASVGIALDEAVRSGHVKHGDIVVLTGFGAGLTWGCDVMRWM